MRSISHIKSSLALGLTLAAPLGAAFTHSLTVLEPAPADWSTIYVVATGGGDLAGIGYNTVSTKNSSWVRDGGTWINLGFLASGDRLQLTDMNAQGQAVGGGNIKAAGMASRAFVYRGGELKDLGVLGASPYLSEDAGGKSSTANAINDKGQIVGISTTSDGSGHAFLYEDRAMRSLGVLGGGNSSSEAFDINNAGVAVGVSGTDAVVFKDGKVTSIGAGKAYVINDAELIAGSTIQEAWVYANGQRTPITLTGATSIRPTGINSLGQVVGKFTSGYNPRCFLYENGTARDLAELADFTKDFISPNVGGCAIDEEGRIYGFALNNAFKNTLFVLTPLTPPNPFAGLKANAWAALPKLGWNYGFQDGPGWSYSLVLGQVYSAAYPWLYTIDGGYLYHVAGDLKSGATFYSIELGAYLWMSAAYGNWAYRYDTQAWVRL